MATRQAKLLDTRSYATLLADIQSILEVQKRRAEKAQKLIQVQSYWLTGERISREVGRQEGRASYGQQLVSLLSQDTGISVSHLNAMIQFYRTYPIMQHLSPELDWSHYLALISINDPEIRRFYEVQAIANRWSVRELRRRLQQKEHQKVCKEAKIEVVRPRQIPSVREVVKDSYDFNFLQLSEYYSEQELEQGLLQHIGRFLLELGYGFAFVGSQYKIPIADQLHRLDLVFFHLPLSCYILVDLKIEKFCDRFVGQMNKYLTYFRENECYPYMKDPIGLLICKEKDANEVHYALGRLKEEIFVAEYRYCLPNEADLVSHLTKFNPPSAILTSRPLRAIQKLPAGTPFSVHDYQAAANTSIATARRDLKELLEQKKIMRQGHGKGTLYQIPV